MVGEPGTAAAAGAPGEPGDALFSGVAVAAPVAGGEPGEGLAPGVAEDPGGAVGAGAGAVEGVGGALGAAEGAGGAPVGGDGMLAPAGPACAMARVAVSKHAIPARHARARTPRAVHDGRFCERCAAKDSRLPCRDPWREFGGGHSGSTLRGLGGIEAR